MAQVGERYRYKGPWDPCAEFGPHPYAAKVGVVVDASLLGNPTSLNFRAATQNYHAYDGTSGFGIEDRTDQAQCSW